MLWEIPHIDKSFVAGLAYVWSDIVVVTDVIGQLAGLDESLRWDINHNHSLSYCFIENNYYWIILKVTFCHSGHKHTVSLQYVDVHEQWANWPVWSLFRRLDTDRAFHLKQEESARSNQLYMWIIRWEKSVYLCGFARVSVRPRGQRRLSGNAYRQTAFHHCAHVDVFLGCLWTMEAILWFCHTRIYKVAQVPHLNECYLRWWTVYHTLYTWAAHLQCESSSVLLDFPTEKHL